MSSEAVSKVTRESLHQPITSLEAHGIPSDPKERKKFEAEMRAKHGQAQPPVSANPQNVNNYEQNLSVGSERVFLVNNRARPIHIPDEEIVIDGQLAVSARGPFLQISRERLNQSYQLQAYFDQPVSKVHPRLKRTPVLEELTEQQFKKRYQEYQKSKAIRQEEYAKVGNPASRHSDGTVDAEDAAFDVHTVNPTVIRATG